MTQDDSFKILSEDHRDPQEIVTRLKHIAYVVDYAADDIAMNSVGEGPIKTINTAIESLKKVLTTISEPVNHDDRQLNFPFNKN